MLVVPGGRAEPATDDGSRADRITAVTDHSVSSASCRAMSRSVISTLIHCPRNAARIAENFRSPAGNSDAAWDCREFGVGDADESFVEVGADLSAFGVEEAEADVTYCAESAEFFLLGFSHGVAAPSQQR